MSDDGKLKLLGKLGLDLTRLNKDVKSLDKLSDHVSKSSKEMGKSWKLIADEMKNAFSSFPINDYIKALKQFENAQKNGLNKQAKESAKFQASERRKEEKHKAAILNREKATNEKIENLKLLTNQKLAQNDEKYQQKELMQLKNHFSNVDRLYDKSQSSLQKRFNSLTDYAIASGAMFGTGMAVRQMIDINREFEKQQISLQRVLGATAEEMKRVKDMTLEVSKATGIATNDIQTIENLWIRTGRQNLNELKELTEVTAVGINTAEFQDAGESVSFLNGAINQMVNGDWKQAQAILDSWSKTSDYTAVKTTEDLAEVISRAGSQAKALGLSFHDLNAVTAILTERTAYGGEKIGTAMKTVFTRFQDIDNVDKLKAFGVDILDETGKQYRDFTDIMDDLNAKFKYYKETGNGVAAAQISEILGGTRQVNIVNNLIEGWDRYGEIVNISLNSAGYSAEQNEKIMQSFDKQIEVLKTSFVDLSLAIGENGLIPMLSGLVEGTREAVEWYNNLNPHMKNTITVALELGAAFTALNLTVKKFSQIGILERVFNTVLKGTGFVKDLAKAEELLNLRVKAQLITEKEKLAILGMLNGTEKASMLVGEARTAMLEAQTAVTYGATAATTALNLAITAGLVVIPLIIGAISSHKRSIEELNQKTIERITTQRDEVKNTEALIAEYDKLNNSTMQTADEKARLNEIEQEFAEIYPTTVTGLNEQNVAYSDQIGLVKQLTLEKKKALLQEAQLYVSANQSDIVKLRQKLANLQSEYNGADTTYMTIGGEHYEIQNDAEETSEDRLKILDKMKEVNEKIEEYEKNWSLISEVSRSLADDASKADFDTKYQSGYQAGYAPTDKSTYVPDATDLIDMDDFNDNLDYLAHQNNLGKLTKSQYASKLKDALDSYKNQGGTDNSVIWDLEEQIYGLLKSDSSSKADIPKPMQAIMDSLEHNLKMDNISESDYANTLEDALSEYKSQMTENAIWSVQEKIYSLRKSSAEKYVAIDFDSLKASLAIIDKEIATLMKEEEWLTKVGNSKTAVMSVLSNELKAQSKSQRELISVGNDYRALLAKVNEQINNLNPNLLNYDDMLKALIEDKKKLTDEIESNTQALWDNAFAIENTNEKMMSLIKDSIREAYTLQKEMSDYDFAENQKAALESLQSEIDSYNDMMDESIKKKQDELDLLDEQISKEEKLNELADLRSELEKVKADTRYAYIDEQSGKEVYTYDKAKAAELEKEIADKIREQENDDRREALQDQIEALEDQREAKNKAYDKQMENLEDFQRREKESYDKYWRQRLSDEAINNSAFNLVQEVGFSEAIGIALEYLNSMNETYTQGNLDAIAGGKSITDGLREGLFEEIDSVIAEYQAKLASITPFSSGSGGNILGMSDADYKRYVENKEKAGEIYAKTGNWKDENILPLTAENNALREKYGITDTNTLDELKNGIKTYHSGGFVDGQALNPKHEVLAKMLKGEYVLSLPTMDRLSLSLPSVVHPSVPKITDSNSGAGRGENVIMINIDKLTPSDFEGFMASMRPYINARK